MTTEAEPLGEADADAEASAGSELSDAVVEVAEERAWRADAARADGRRRRRQGLIVLGAALASAGVGVLIGMRIKSPADEAASRRPPPPSRITVPVQRQVLSSSLVLAGEVRFNEPTAVRLAGSVGVDDGETQVVTKVPAVDQVAQEGDVLFEVTGRPVFFLQGDLPMYRRLTVGSEGTDVVQLEQALERLGHQPGVVDNIFDAATGEAVAALYEAAGFVAEGPTRAQRDELRLARQAVADAEDALRTARADLDGRANTVPQSQLLQAQQAVQSAEAAVPAAEAAAARANELAAQQVRTATVARDSARTIRDSAVTVRDALKAPGAIDPDTGAPPTAARLAELDAAVARAAQDLQAAEAAVVTATTDQQAVAAQGQTDVAASRAQLELARVQLAELTAPVDVSEAQKAVEQAQVTVDTANADLEEVSGQSGVRLSPGEIVFLPILPSTVTELFAAPGSPTVDQLATMSTADTLVSGRVSRVDSALVTVGAPVTISLRDVAFETTGTVLSVGQPQDDGEGGGGGGGSGRLEVLIAPDDPAVLREYVFFGARITIDVASTDGEVLVVPVSALSVGANGASRVEVETSPITELDPGATTLIEVEVGLTADGLVEVSSPDLAVDDRVVVGVETNQRRNADESESTEPETTEPETTEPDGGETGGDGSGG